MIETHVTVFETRIHQSMDQYYNSYKVFLGNPTVKDPVKCYWLKTRDCVVVGLNPTFSCYDFASHLEQTEKIINGHT